MSNQQRAVVNQRLYFCQLHLGWLEAQLLKQDIPLRVVEQSLGESMLFHLVLCYRAYLSEVATAYGYPVDNLTHAGQLIDHLSVQQLRSGEAIELSGLELSDSWLSALLSQYEQLGPVNLALSSTDIKTISVSPVLELDSNVLRNYFNLLNEVIENQRTRLEEW